MTKTILFVALLTSSMWVSAQQRAATISWTGGEPKPTCVYKPVMSDAEIQICTGHPVRYNYNVVNETKVWPVLPAQDTAK